MAPHHFACLLAALTALCAAQNGPVSNCPPNTTVWEKTLPGPASPDEQAAWLANLNVFRAAARAQYNYTSSVYDNYLSTTRLEPSTAAVVDNVIVNFGRLGFAFNPAVGIDGVGTHKLSDLLPTPFKL